MSFDVIIVGGGLAGLSLACALRDTRLQIALVETHPPRPVDGWDARIYAISPANARFLQRIGAWKHLDPARLTPVHAMQVFGDDAAQLGFSAYQSGVDELAWILESAQLSGELWENLRRQSRLTLFCPASPQELVVNNDLATLTLSDGQSLSAKLVIGADGRDSWVRDSAGLTANHSPYGEMGVVANFDCEHPHHGTAFQWFRDDGVLAWLPLPGKRLSMVWSAPDPLAKDLLALSPDALCARVAAAGRHRLGELKLITPASAFPLRLTRVPSTVSARIALIGDAAHGIHPLTGHGINLGLRDADALAQILAQTPDWQDIGDLRRLRRYQRERREETTVLQYTTHTLRLLFRETLPGLKIVRNAGMALTDRLPTVKELLVRYALGT